jgi:hypothetical protein
MKEITPAHIRYIKLGDSGRWAQESISEGSICFGYHSIPHETCQAKDWARVRELLSERRSEGAQTAGQQRSELSMKWARIAFGSHLLTVT